MKRNKWRSGYRKPERPQCPICAEAWCDCEEELKTVLRDYNFDITRWTLGGPKIDYSRWKMELNGKEINADISVEKVDKVPGQLHDDPKLTKFYDFDNKGHSTLLGWRIIIKNRVVTIKFRNNNAA